MDIAYYKNCCVVFYNSTHCPIHLFQKNKEMLRVPQHSFPFVEYHYKELSQQDKPFSYLLSNSSLHYALIKAKENDITVVIGPYPLHSFSYTETLNVIKEYSLPENDNGKVTDFFQASGKGLYGQFFHIIELIYFLINQKCIDVEQYLFGSLDHKNLIAQKHLEAVTESKELESFHNTYEFEQLLFKKVSDGDVSYFQNDAENAFDLHTGKVAENNLRQEKNLFIVTTALTTRAAIAGGLPVEVAYQLSDEYIQTAEQMLSPDAISKLSGTMVLDFTERVNAHKIPSDISKEIYECIQYIKLHTNSEISVQSISDVIGISRSHLSKKFKAELGFDISSFIMSCKLEEAKSLLAFTDKSIIDISNYLCFSSQSYFTNVFKNKYGITPKEFRCKNKV